MKRIVYTKHAEEMLVRRNLKKVFVTSCLTKPDKKEHAKENKRAYLKDFGRNYLKVIVSEESNALVILTLYWIAKDHIKK